MIFDIHLRLNFVESSTAGEQMELEVDLVETDPPDSRIEATNPDIETVENVSNILFCNILR